LNITRGLKESLFCKVKRRQIQCSKRPSKVFLEVFKGAGAMFKHTVIRNKEQPKQ
jgi:hypothetical protein